MAAHVFKADLKKVLEETAGRHKDTLRLYSSGHLNPRNIGVSGQALSKEEVSHWAVVQRGPEHVKGRHRDKLESHSISLQRRTRVLKQQRKSPTRHETDFRVKEPVATTKFYKSRRHRENFKQQWSPLYGSQTGPHGTCEGQSRYSDAHLLQVTMHDKYEKIKQLETNIFGSLNPKHEMIEAERHARRLTRNLMQVCKAKDAIPSQGFLEGIGKIFDEVIETNHTASQRFVFVKKGYETYLTHLLQQPNIQIYPLLKRSLDRSVATRTVVTKAQLEEAVRTVDELEEKVKRLMADQPRLEEEAMQSVNQAAATTEKKKKSLTEDSLTKTQAISALGDRITSRIHKLLVHKAEKRNSLVTQNEVKSVEESIDDITNEISQLKASRNNLRSQLKKKKQTFVKQVRKILGYTERSVKQQELSFDRYSMSSVSTETESIACGADIEYIADELVYLALQDALEDLALKQSNKTLAKYEAAYSNHVTEDNVKSLSYNVLNPQFNYSISNDEVSADVAKCSEKVEQFLTNLVERTFEELGFGENMLNFEPKLCLCLSENNCECPEELGIIDEFVNELIKKVVIQVMASQT